MNEYRLNIDLSFQTKAEAHILMDACEPLLTQPDSISAKDDIVEVLKTRINQNVERMSQILAESEETRQRVASILIDSESNISEMKREKALAEEKLTELYRAITNIEGTITEHKKATQSLIGDAELSINNTSVLLKEFDALVENTHHIFEAGQFIQEMTQVKNNIVTGGKVSLQWRDPGKEGEKWFPIDGWEFSRKHP